MRMAIYHPWVYLTSGIERCFVELLSRSRHEWTIYTHHFAPESTYPELGQHRVVELEPGVSVRRRFGALVQAAGRISATRLPDGISALLVSSEGLGDLIMARNRIPAAVYCHTPLKILHDPVNRAALERTNPKQAAALRVLGPLFSAADRRMWRRFSHRFANSRETHNRIVTAKLAAPGDVEILHPGVDTNRFTPGTARREDLYLVAGRIMWQKNIELAIDALRLAHEQGSQARLVVAGRVDDKSKEYLAALRSRAAGLPVTFEVNPADERLIDLYRTCLALLFTPRNEDFGMVPLEAMACGAPVLAVDVGGPRETVLDGQTGWLLRDDPAAFAERLLAVERADDLARLRQSARAQAERFGWDRFVERIDAVMAGLATRAGPPGP